MVHLNSIKQWWCQWSKLSGTKYIFKTLHLTATHMNSITPAFSFSPSAHLWTRLTRIIHLLQSSRIQNAEWHPYLLVLHFLTVEPVGLNWLVLVLQQDRRGWDQGPCRPGRLELGLWKLKRDGLSTSVSQGFYRTLLYLSIGNTLNLYF